MGEKFFFPSYWRLRETVKPGNKMVILNRNGDFE